MNAVLSLQLLLPLRLGCSAVLCQNESSVLSPALEFGCKIFHCSDKMIITFRCSENAVGSTNLATAYFAMHRWNDTAAVYREAAVQ